MSMFSDYKSYKTYLPDYAQWKSERDLADAKRLAYFEQNPSEIKHSDIQKGKSILRAIDVMDEYSQKKAENMEVATEQVVSTCSTILMTIGAGIGLLFRKNKALINICEKFIKDSKNLEQMAMFISTSIGGILGMTVGVFPLYAWAARKEIQASRKGRLEAMTKELNDTKSFAILNEEQEQQFNENLNKIPLVPDKKNVGKSIKESFSTIKDLTTTSKSFLQQQMMFNKRVKEDEQYFDSELTPEEIQKAKEDQQLLTKFVEKIDIASQDYAENAELATGALSLAIFSFGSLFSLGYEKLAQKLKWKSSVIPHVLSFAAMLGVSMFSASIQKEASRVGRFKVKQDLLNNPAQMVYLSDEKAKEIDNIEVAPHRKENMPTFLKNAWKNNKAYKKWKKTEGLKEKNISKALENIELTEEQLKEARRLQHNTFKTFNKIDENSQKYSESIEALGQSMQVPIAESFSLVGAAVGIKHLQKAMQSKLASERTAGFVKYFALCIAFSIPALIINAFITKEQKKATRVADMISINELSSYRHFADYSRVKYEK